MSSPIGKSSLLAAGWVRQDTARLTYKMENGDSYSATMRVTNDTPSGLVAWKGIVDADGALVTVLGATVWECAAEVEKIISQLR